MHLDSSTAALGTLHLDGTGALRAIDDVGARLLGFRAADECLITLRGQLFATERGARAAAEAGAGAVRFRAECRGAQGLTRACELYAGSGGREIVALFAPIGREEEARRSSLLAGLIQGLPNPVFAKDAQQRWIALNDSCCQLIGRCREELLGRSEFDCFPPAQARVFWSGDDRVFASGEPSESEGVIINGAGQQRAILIRKSLQHDDQGRPILLGVITDITERRQRDEALRRSRDELDEQAAERTQERQQANVQLRESEQRFHILADALPQIVWTAVTSGELDYINSRGCEYSGIPVEDGLQHGWLDAVHPEDRPRVWERWSCSLRSGESYEAEFRLRRWDGAYRWQLVRALPVRDASGRVVRWFGSATDIEDQKQAQQTLQDEDRRKNDFLAMLGHELRNPLTPIRNAVYLLRQARLEAAAFERAVGIIERQVTLMARLIHDLLDLSRIARGKISLKKERFDLVTAVRTLLDDRRESLAAGGLRLEVDLPAGPLWVEADAARVGQAVSNLVENAEKYTDRGGTVRVEVEADGGAAEVVVRDTGIGLSAVALEQVFEPFVQAGGIAVAGRGGLGLGLSLVKSLAELHGGSVEAHSRGEGTGSTFVLRLPLAPGPLAAESSPPSAPTPRPAGSRRILIVEDNPDAAESLRLMLELDGHQVELAASGEEGVARARAIHPDVVLSDVGLPGMSGYDLARALRADPAVQARLVAITGYGQSQDREEALRSGFDHHLTKPFDHNCLQQLLAGFQS